MISSSVSPVVVGAGEDLAGVPIQKVVVPVLAVHPQGAHFGHQDLVDGLDAVGLPPPGR